MRIGVLGLGAWGTALAVMAARAGNEVVLWGRDAERARVVERLRENRWSLPGVELAPDIHVTAVPEVLDQAEAVLAAVPAQSMRAALGQLRPLLPPSAPLILCAKGIEQGSGALMTAVAEAVLPGCEVAVLSGPSFAADVGRGLPTALVLAGRSLDRAAALASGLASPSLRLYHSDDRLGVEIGGAVKNVLAIACGIAEGRGLGASAVAALTARAVAELLRFGAAVGARPETLMGLSGLGDLVLTCRSSQSRNFAFGLTLGRGEAAPAARGGTLVEGALTAPVLADWARRRDISMPVAESVAAVLSGVWPIAEAIDRLMSRPARAERDDAASNLEETPWPNGS